MYLRDVNPDSLAFCYAHTQVEKFQVQTSSVLAFKEFSSVIACNKVKCWTMSGLFLNCINSLENEYKPNGISEKEGV